MFYGGFALVVCLLIGVLPLDYCLRFGSWL